MGSDGKRHTPAADIDALYDEYCARLPNELRHAARTLASRLGLAPHAGVPWSRVFNHEVTLSAPGLFAEAFPSHEKKLVADAVLTHMLAVIDAFGMDRIEDGQIQADDTLRRVLAATRRARDEAFDRLIGATAQRIFDPTLVDTEALASIRAERVLLKEGGLASFERYAEISFGKQGPGFMGSLALAVACGGTHAQLDLVRSTLSGIWLGLQYFDDVNDWEDDAARGGAWAIALARSGVDVDPSSSADALRAEVLGTGVLHRMLEMSRIEFAQARRSSLQLGARRLAAWVTEQEQRVSEAARAEQQWPGYTVRARRLSTWVAKALA